MDTVTRQRILGTPIVELLKDYLDCHPEVTAVNGFLTLPSMLIGSMHDKHLTVGEFVQKDKLHGKKTEAKKQGFLGRTLKRIGLEFSDEIPLATPENIHAIEEALQECGLSLNMSADEVTAYAATQTPIQRNQHEPTICEEALIDAGLIDLTAVSQLMENRGLNRAALGISTDEQLAEFVSRLAHGFGGKWSSADVTIANILAEHMENIAETHDSEKAAALQPNVRYISTVNAGREISGNQAKMIDAYARLLLQQRSDRQRKSA